MLGIPFEFILFALTLAGIALFHRHTLRVAVIGLSAIVAYKLMVTGFRTGPGIDGLITHLGHEWVVLANLFGLLVGFALLAQHFHDSRAPDVLPRFLPDDWKGGFVLLLMVFVLSSFLDNIAAAVIGGTIASTVFRGRVHLGYLAAIVAASNAGGSGSVVGDTTTTMMWIAGVSPISVLHAYVAAAVAMLFCGVVAARQQQRYAPIAPDPPAGVRVDWVRLGVVGFILLAAIAANVATNVGFPELADRFPVHRRRGLDGVAGGRAVAATGLATGAGGAQGQRVPAVAGARRFADAGGKFARGFLEDGVRARFCFRGVRQHTAHRTGASAGRL